MKRILICLLPAILLIVAFRSKENFTVTGKVTDKAGAALAGVNIIEKGKTTATLTKADGTYSITVTDKNSTLVFSWVGFENQEVKIKGKAVINVSLKPSAKQLEEVVVTAYGMASNFKVRGQSSMSVTSNTLYGYSAPSNYLQGKVAGVITKADKRIPGITTEDDFNTEDYDKITENSFLKTIDNPLSTFSIDVDAASYSNIRRYLNDGELPPAGAVRIEEMINYFNYDYKQPDNGQPFSIQTEIADAPWNKDHKLVMIGLQGKKVPVDKLPSSNLVFLIDVSGSMESENKLPLVKASLKMLADQLREQDRVSIVVYAGAAGLVLPPTNGGNKIKIKEALDKLEAGGSTAGGEGLRLAYKTAEKNFVKGGNNRVILCTDGDFNVGESSDDAMERLIEKERETGVFLTVLGYGMGNYKDNKMQKIADKGNGNHAYIDGLSEAKKVLVNEFGGTLFTIAKDVKLQVEFNPAKVQGYRLIGYENRMLAKEDFNDDKKDAGELGSGHTVTALYEVIPAGVKTEWLKNVDDLKYQKNNPSQNEKKPESTNEILTVKFRYKAPDGDVSKLIEHAVEDIQISLAKTSDNFRFAAAVAEFGMLLRNSEFKGQSSFADVVKIAKGAKGDDKQGYRTEFIKLVNNARTLALQDKDEPEEEEIGWRR